MAACVSVLVPFTWRVSEGSAGSALWPLVLLSQASFNPSVVTSPMGARVQGQRKASPDKHCRLKPMLSGVFNHGVCPGRTCS